MKPQRYTWCENVITRTDRALVVPEIKPEDIVEILASANIHIQAMALCIRAGACSLK